MMPNSYKEKSAFTDLIYGDLPIHFYAPGIDMVIRLTDNIVPKYYQAHDLFLVYHRPYDVVHRSLKRVNKAAPAWRAFIEAMIRSIDYLEINQITSGSMELAAAAAARALSLTNTKVQIDALDNIRNMKQTNAHNLPQGAQQQVQAAGAAGGAGLVEKIQEVAGQVVRQVLKEVQSYLEARREAEAAAWTLGGGHGYNLEGLSVWRFFEDPEEFRRRVRLLSTAALALRQFSRVLPASLNAASESLWGSVEGTTKMQSYEQLSRLLPSELAMSRISRALFAAKLAQMALNVHKYAAAVRPVLFVDKSGSMAEELTGSPGMTKISLATGLALALYRRMNGAIYLFDTEVDKVTPRDVVRLLLTIMADGGTNIDPVLEEITRIGRRDHIFIIISDGITEASQGALKQFVESGLARQTRLILVPPSGEEAYKWVEVVRRHGRVVKAADVASFVAAARQAVQPT